jgi:3D (Asp-Asp-Asp) domain-containing protein
MWLTLVFVLLWPLSVSRAELPVPRAPVLKPVRYVERITRNLEWQWVHAGKVKITAYCANCAVCDTGWRTADMTYADYRKGIVAADKKIPFGLQFSIDGLDDVYTVRDRGQRVSGTHLDVLMKSHWAARKFGVQYRDVWVWKQVETETREYVQAGNAGE